MMSSVKSGGKEFSGFGSPQNAHAEGQQASASEHLIAPGETLSEIAFRYRTTVDALLQANQQIRNPDLIIAGASIKIVLHDPASAPIEVTVARGNTLSQLAAKHGNSLSEVRHANWHALPHPHHIEVGQKLWLRRHEHHGAPAFVSAKVSSHKPTVVPHQKVSEKHAQPVVVKQEDKKNPTSNAPAAQAKVAEKKQEQEQPVAAAKTHAPTKPVPTDASGVPKPTQAPVKDKRKAQERPTSGEKEQAPQQQASAKQEESVVKKNKTAVAKSNDEQVAHELAKSTKNVTPKQASTDAEDPESPKKPIASAESRAAAKAEKIAARTRQIETAPDVAAALVALDADSTQIEDSTALLAAAMPQLTKLANRQKSQRHGTPQSPPAIGAAMSLAARAQATPEGDQLRLQLAQIGPWNPHIVTAQIGDGGSPAYALAYAKAHPQEGKAALNVVRDGLKKYCKKIDGHMTQFARHQQDLAWMATQVGAVMTPEQRSEATAQYVKDQGPAWEKKTEALRLELARDGVRLIDHLALLTPAESTANAPGASSAHGKPTALDDAICDTVLEPNARQAISLALDQWPALIDKASAQRLADYVYGAQFISDAKISKEAHKLAAAFVKSYVRTNVIGKIANFDPHNVESVRNAHIAIDNLRTAPMARAFGIAPNDLKRAVNALQDLIPAADEDIAQRMVRLTKLNKTLSGIRILHGSTFPGRLMHGLGLVLAGTAVFAAGTRMTERETLKNDFKLLIEGLGLGHKGIEFGVALKAIERRSALAQFGNELVSKRIGIASGLWDVWSATEAFQEDNPIAGGLYATGAAGTFMAALGAELAPLGVGLVLTSAVLLGVNTHAREMHRHEPDRDGGAAVNFLLHAGINAPRARALMLQNSLGDTIFPMLARYALWRGVELNNRAGQQRLANWINQLDDSQARFVRVKALSLAQRVAEGYRPPQSQQPDQVKPMGFDALAGSDIPSPYSAAGSAAGPALTPELELDVALRTAGIPTI